VFNQQLAGAAQVVIADGGDEQPAAAEVGFQTSPGNRASVTVRLDTGEIRRLPRTAIADLAPGERDRQRLKA